MSLDLVYIPNHSNSKNVDIEFFKRVRSSYYVVSGNDSTAEEPSRTVLDSLLEGKAQWESNMQVSSSLVFLPGTLNFSGKQLWEAKALLEWMATARDMGFPARAPRFANNVRGHPSQAQRCTILGHSPISGPSDLSLENKQFGTPGLQGHLAVSRYCYTIYDPSLETCSL